ncbi:MAG: signal peptide peptidase SppA [Planctomycetia bacterium]|nr:signal peptide peptidase SppA [Planctomycetia bacterium]
MNDDSIYNVAPDNTSRPGATGTPFNARPIPVSQVCGSPQYRAWAPPRQSWFFRFLKEMFLAFFGFIFSLFFFLFLVIILCAGLGALLQGDAGLESTVTEKVLSGSDLSPYKVAILPIEGVIQGKEDGFVRNAIRQAAEDPRLSALVLRINSPGGTMSGSDYYYSLLKDLKTTRNIPVIVSMGALAASGGYYIATVGDKIFAERSTLTGSIGVIIPLYNGADLCEKIGIHSTAVTSGPMKGMGDFTKPMSEEEKTIWQGLVDSSYEQFLSVVKEGRPAFGRARPEVQEETETQPNEAQPDEADAQAAETQEKSEISDSTENNANTNDSDPFEGSMDASAPVEKTDNAVEAAEADKDAQLRKIADGRIYTAAQAQELGLIDELGFLDAAVKEAFHAAHIDEDATQVVRYKSGGSLAELFGSSSEEISTESVPAMIQNALSPEVYYLCPRTLPF